MKNVGHLNGEKENIKDMALLHTGIVHNKNWSFGNNALVSFYRWVVSVSKLRKNN